jgi:lysophosphatidylglycerol acyltransferase 1
MTIAYPGGQAPNALSLIFSMWKYPPIHVHYRVYNIYKVPSDPKGFTEWLYERYGEKDTLLNEYYQTGTFMPNFPKTVDTDKFTFCFL